MGLFATLLAALKYILGGDKLPNWAKVILVALVIIAIFFGQQVAVTKLADVQRETTESQIRALRSAVYILRSDNLDIRADIQAVAADDSARAKRLEKKINMVSAKLDYINENGTDASSIRIEQMSLRLNRLLKERNIKENKR